MLLLRILQSMHVANHYTEYLEQAKAVEDGGDLEKAATLYEHAIRQEPFEEHPYNRLMILYRKLKQPKDELRIINKALEVFQLHYDEKAAHFSGKDKLGQLSKALLKSLTGSSKKTSYTHYPEPIPKWTRRKKLLEKKRSAKNNFK
jgi:tetratricopeptide (TPR) repeat protein